MNNTAWSPLACTNAACYVTTFIIALGLMFSKIQLAFYLSVFEWCLVVVAATCISMPIVLIASAVLIHPIILRLSYYRKQRIFLSFFAGLLLGVILFLITACLIFPEPIELLKGSIPYGTRVKERFVICSFAALYPILICLFSALFMHVAETKSKKTITQR